ncbi:MAG: TonB-dependent receptor plug domain-containing protein, partial [Flavisolibacter sp.]|nr:TonB-dependent receptor plug domain-containing protein [Flavisolibacter sp.]
MKRIAFFLCLFTSGTLWAQEDTTALVPVEVRATRAPATAPFSKTNISKAQIEKQNLGQDLPFLLNQTPSVVVNSDAGNGIGYTGIRIRGTDQTRINVTLNGIPFNDPESQGTFFVDLPDFASSVNSIQIQRGVGTSSNGAGAFGATINLSTNEVNKESYAEFNNSYGSFNTWKNTVKAGTGLLGHHFTTDVRLSHISSDGYIDRAATNLKSFYFSTAYLADKSSVRINIFSGKERTYQAWYGVLGSDLKNNRTINYAGTEKPDVPYENETDNYVQTHYQLFFNHQFNPKLVVNTGLFYVQGAGYYEQYKADQKYAKYSIANPVYGKDTTKRSDMIRQLWLDSDFYGDVFSALYSSGRTQLTFGGAVTRYTGAHFGDVIWAKNGLPAPKVRWYDNDAWKGDANVYTKWQQDLTPAFQSFIDLQYRRVDYNINGFRDNPALSVKNNYNFFNPKAGISYHQINWLLYASYSLANKEPNRDDFE